jgi:hypothetical protein
MHTIISGETVLEEMPRILEWIASLGLPSSRGRYSRYIHSIDTFFAESNPNSDEGRRAFELARKSYRECLEIFLVYRAFHSESATGFRDRLDHATCGPEHLAAGSPTGSRDYMFELLVAARFTGMGYLIDFNTQVDVIAQKGEHIIQAECKRISSAKKFRGRFISAGDQLRLRRQEVQATHGMIFIDVSNCVSGILPAPELDTIHDANRAIGVAMQHWISRHAAMIEQLNERFLDCSLGVALIGQFSPWTRDTLGPTTATTTAVRATKQLPDNIYAELEKIMQGFDQALHNLCSSIQ